MSAIPITSSRPAETSGAWSVSGSAIHLIGIGGCGMRGVAAMLQQLGARISGSDVARFEDLGELVSAGAVIQVGHRVSNLPAGADLVVASAAIPENNPELIAARAASIPIIGYAELVGRLMSARVGVAIAGTHGKSTTTSLTATMYRLGGLDPSFIIGAQSRQLGSGAAVGTGQHFIVESCEYARSFLHHRPRLAALLNIERDHLDCYSGLDEIVAAFTEFAEHVPPDGVVIARHQDPAVDRATAGLVCPVETFGFESDACWRATDLDPVRGQYQFTVRYRDRALFDVRMLVPGLHNVSNALAAAALAWHGGVQPEAIAEAIRTFEGLDRRMSLRSTGGGVTVVDDYAHHPTEIAVTLRAIRSRYEPRRTWVVFQPHQHSRTRLLMDQFAECFAEADVVLVPDIYAVRDSEDERRLTGSGDLVDRIHACGGQARYVPRLQDVTDHLVEELCDGDLVVTMGAGDVWKVADELAERVRRTS